MFSMTYRRRPPPVVKVGLMLALAGGRKAAPYLPFTGPFIQPFP